MSNQTIETIYNELYEQATTRTKQSLEILKAACESQVNIKATDFTVATIGLLSDELGGIKAKAMRNKEGKHFKQLVEAYSAIYSPKVTKPTKKDPLDWISDIEDAGTRIKVYDLYAENKQLRNERNLLSAVKVVEVDMRLSSGSQSDQVRLENKLDHDELQALSHFISDRNLKSWAWTKGPNGELVDQTGRNATQKGFVDAIEKLLLIEEGDHD
jgi:hypothetical protein